MRRLVILTVVAAAASSSFGQIFNGRLNDFQDGTTQFWDGFDVSNVPNGGPTGAGDAYLQVVSYGGSGPGSRLATYCDFWSGDYQAAGVNRIEVMFRNFSNVDLSMRVVLFDGFTQARWTSVNAFTLAANSGWVTASFGLAESDLVRVLGSSDYNSVITNTSRLMIRHDNSPPSAGGSPVVATVGMDNIRAVPEPATFAALGMGALALIRRKRKA